MAILSYYIEMSRDEKCHQNSSKKLETSSQSYTEMPGDEHSESFESDKSGVTLPSYIEMCGNQCVLSRAQLFKT